MDSGGIYEYERPSQLQNLLNKKNSFNIYYLR